MNSSIEQATWEEVLDAYVDAAEAPSHALMMEWISRFPQYRQELVEFTVAWSQAANQTPLRDEEVDEEGFVLRGMSVVQNLLYEQSDKDTSTAFSDHPITTIVAEARRLKVTIESLAGHLEISQTLLAKLDRHYVAYASIPVQLIESLAQALERDVVSLSRYLIQPPTLAPAASYKAAQAPHVSAQESFFDAVRRDPEMSAELRQRWLALEPTTE